MKKIALSIGVITLFVAYALFMRNTGSGAPALTQQTGTTPSPTSAGSESINPSTGSSGSTSTPPATTPNSYKDGTYTGQVADAFYGNIQVQAIIQNGKLSDVQFLQYPNDRRDSVEINQQAMPMLKEEAIQAQSAHVNGVTGATDTSQAFVESLSSALSKAI